MFVEAQLVVLTTIRPIVVVVVHPLVVVSLAVVVLPVHQWEEVHREAVEVEAVVAVEDNFH